MTELSSVIVACLHVFLTAASCGLMLTKCISSISSGMKCVLFIHVYCACYKSAVGNSCWFGSKGLTTLIWHLFLILKIVCPMKKYDFKCDKS